MRVGGFIADIRVEATDPHPSRFASHPFPACVRAQVANAGEGLLGVQCEQDTLENIRSISAEVRAWETEDFESFGAEEALAPQVMFTGLCVINAIQLDDQLPADAAEVGEIWSDRNLTAEFDPCQSPIA